MGSKQDCVDTGDFRGPARGAGPLPAAVPPGGCYGVQVLVAGRHKRWRDEVSAEIRRAGYSATTVESARDALTVLVLGIPVDVLVTDADLHGTLGYPELAAKARALRPGLGIVLACDALPGEESDVMPRDAIRMPRRGDKASLASNVREALSLRA